MRDARAGRGWPLERLVYMFRVWVGLVLYPEGGFLAVTGHREVALPFLSQETSGLLGQVLLVTRPSGVAVNVDVVLA